MPCQPPEACVSGKLVLREQGSGARIMKTARKLSGSRGIAAAVVVLAVLVLVLAVAVLVPVYREYRYQAQMIGCVSSLKSANDQLAIETITGGDITADQAQAIVTRAMDGWDDLCPGGGTPYLIENEDEGARWMVVCGLHDKDTKRRTRLNASNVLAQIRQQADMARKLGSPVPEEISVRLNGKTYQAVLTEQETGLKRGTRTTSGIKGTVICYGVSGCGAFSDSPQPDGSICYFSFGDEDHCAIWHVQEGWTGDSYG